LLKLELALTKDKMRENLVIRTCEMEIDEYLSQEKDERLGVGVDQKEHG